MNAESSCDHDFDWPSRDALMRAVGEKLPLPDKACKHCGMTSAEYFGLVADRAPDVLERLSQITHTANTDEILLLNDCETEIERLEKNYAQAAMALGAAVQELFEIRGLLAEAEDQLWKGCPGDSAELRDRIKRVIERDAEVGGSE